MANNDDKKWNRPWSMEEMIENAENWSLAGDFALLNTLKAYSENLFTKTVSISDNVDNLLHSLDEVSLKLDLSQNEFQSLRNTQFIESRVYEDDETLDIKEEPKPEEKPPEEEKEKTMREAVFQGLRVMDKYFEKIEVSISDSEDEESDKSYLLRPKDLYADRPLPLIIGTEEWYKKWHVGLADSSSESESEKMSEIYSESDSEDDLPKDLMKGSETSSDLDFSSQTSDNRPVANSTFNDSAKKPNVFGSDEESVSDEQGSLPVKTPISNKNFAEQLAAKLGDVINEREDVSSEINRKPIQPAQKFAGDLFSDEPPPLDDDLEDTILPKSAQDGLFSGGRGLFDDNEDEPFWGQQKETAAKPPIETGAVKQEPEQKASVGAKPLPKSSQVSKGLFDSDSDSTEEDIFTTKQTQVKKQFLQPFTTTPPLFDDKPPELDASKKSTEDTIKKKPVGGVSIFGKADLFSGENVENILKSRQKDLDDKEKVVETKPNEISTKSDKKNQQNVKPKQHSLFDEEEQPRIETPPNPVSPKPKKISLFDDEEATKPIASTQPKTTGLFDDDDDLFKDDLFSSIATKKLKSGLFDENIFSADVKTNEAPKVDLFKDLTKTEDDLLHKETGQNSLTKPKKNISLFDSDQEEEEEELFVEKSPILNSEASFDGTKNRETETSQGVSAVDEVDKAIVKTVEDLPQRQVIGAEKLSTEKKAAKGLFEDSTEEANTKDVFKGGDILKTQDQGLFGEDQALETENLPSEKKVTKSLFEDSTEENDTANLFQDDQNLQTGNSSIEKKATKGLFDGSTEDSDTENLFKETGVVKTQQSNLFEENQTLETTKNTLENPPANVEKRQEIPELQSTQPTPQASNVPEKVQPRNMTINLFGSSPPPDDDDWDTKSIQSSDNDDQFSYRTDYNTAGSSLFDHEPPSLGPNESSGIVRDQNTTRVDTDDSFNPYASSSRRFSTDVFNEQQSQDSFFVTKNKTESINIAAQLDSIPEMGKSSNLDITPSGILEDFESAKSDNSVFQDISQNDQTTTSISKKPISLFDDYDNSQETDDLFSSVSKKDDLPALSNKRMSLFDNPGDVLDEKNVKQKSDETETERPVKAVESVKEIREKMATSQVAVDEKEAKKPPTGSPGKLKHNLKINVNALMPGSAPPKIRELTKSHSLDLPKDQKDTSEYPSSPDGGFLTPTVSKIQRWEVSSTSAQKATSFEDALNNVEVLHSVTKDRAKIPIKRRPSTRRGRQQVIQSAASDFTLGNEENSRLAATDSNDIETNAKNVASMTQNSAVEPPKLSSPEFLPSSPQENITPPVETPPSRKSPKKGDIFDDLGNADDKIFPSTQPLEKNDNVSVEEKPKSSIFESEDSDDELFGGKRGKKTKTDSQAKKKESVKKKSLFNDSSSDEDLFSSTSNSDTKRKETVQKPLEKKSQKMLTTRKLENIETDEDPLSSLLK